jgi:imidazolonepropionase-like amidohydrolase
VISGDGSLPIENGCIMVEGGMIARIGPADRIVMPQGATRIELAGKTVMPAIIRTHVQYAPTFPAASATASMARRRSI